MKYKEIQKLKPEELQKKYSELKSELMKLKGQSATGTPPKSPGRIKQIKRTIARMNTLTAQTGAEQSTGTKKAPEKTGGRKK